MGLQTDSDVATYPRSPCFAIADLMNPGPAGLIGGLLNVTDEENLLWEAGRSPSLQPNRMCPDALYLLQEKKGKENKAQHTFVAMQK